jgi:hypothetical protein
MGSTNTAYPKPSTDSLWWVYFSMCTQATALSQSSTILRNRFSIYLSLWLQRLQKTLWHAPETYLCLWMQRPQNAQAYSRTFLYLPISVIALAKKRSGILQNVSLSTYICDCIGQKTLRHTPERFLSTYICGCRGQKNPLACSRKVPMSAVAEATKRSGKL